VELTLSELLGTSRDLDPGLLARSVPGTAFEGALIETADLLGRSVEALVLAQPGRYRLYLAGPPALAAVLSTPRGRSLARAASRLIAIAPPSAHGSVGVEVRRHPRLEGEDVRLWAAVGPRQGMAVIARRERQGEGWRCVLTSDRGWVLRLAEALDALEEGPAVLKLAG
jgi:hypothetical protein